MRTVIIILGGFVLWGLSLAGAKLLSSEGGTPYGTATVAFTVIWFAAAAINMWIGVTKAGYGIAEELPIFLLIFLLPVVVAVIVKWKFLGS